MSSCAGCGREIPLGRGVLRRLRRVTAPDERAAAVSARPALATRARRTIRARRTTPARYRPLPPVVTEPAAGKAPGRGHPTPPPAARETRPSRSPPRPRPRITPARGHPHSAPRGERTTPDLGHRGAAARGQRAGAPPGWQAMAASGWRAMQPPAGGPWQPPAGGPPRRRRAIVVTAVVVAALGGLAAWLLTSQPAHPVRPAAQSSAGAGQPGTTGAAPPSSPAAPSPRASTPHAKARHPDAVALGPRRPGNPAHIRSRHSWAYFAAVNDHDYQAYIGLFDPRPGPSRAGSSSSPGSAPPRMPGPGSCAFPPRPRARRRKIVFDSHQRGGRQRHADRVHELAYHAVPGEARRQLPHREGARHLPCPGHELPLSRAITGP